MKAIRLETVVNIATLIACLSVSAAAIHYMRLPVRGSASTPSISAVAAQSRVEPGDKLALPSSTLGNPALVIYLAPACHFCSESMPFYRRLAEQEGIRSGAVQLIVAASQPEAEVRDYLSRHGLSAAAFADSAALGIKTRATPTLALVERDGSVRSAWTGLLDTAKEQGVVDALAGLLKNRH